MLVTFLLNDWNSIKTGGEELSCVYLFKPKSKKLDFKKHKNDCKGDEWPRELGWRIIASKFLIYWFSKYQFMKTYASP